MGKSNKNQNDLTPNENLDDLMAAANLKLQAQQKKENNDIYADMKAEMNQEDATGNIDDAPPTIQYRPSSNEQNNISIVHDGEPEEGYYIEGDPTPVFENGPSIAQIDLWKKQFDKEKVMHAQILDKHFVFRTLNRFEYKQIVAIPNIDALYREEIICSTCTLFPINYDFKKMAVEDSGYPSTLAQIIMENSGFTKEYGIEVL